MIGRCAVSECPTCGARVAVEGAVTLSYKPLGDRVAEAYEEWSFATGITIERPSFRAALEQWRAAAPAQEAQDGE